MSSAVCWLVKRRCRKSTRRANRREFDSRAADRDSMRQFAKRYQADSRSNAVRVFNDFGEAHDGSIESSIGTNNGAFLYY